MSNISLIFFTTTKGHFDQHRIYQKTILELEKQTNLKETFGALVAHIKVSEGDEDIYLEQKKFLEDRGFKVLSTKGKWKHDDVSHYIEHIKDINTLIRDPDVNKNDYIFWLEDDYLFNIKKHNFKYYIDESINKLKNNKDIICNRFYRSDTKDNIEEVRTQLYNYDSETKTYAMEFTFSCSLCRTRDLYVTTLLMEKFYDPYKIHIEGCFNLCLVNMSKIKNQYLVWDRDLIYIIHIQEKNYENGLWK